jgi:putative SOS response-associated peptidase YedK
MCARFVITSPADAVRALFGYDERPNFPPRYNVAPTQPIPIVRLVNGARSYALVRWGFLPAWVKDPKTFSLLVNARGESALDKPSFRNAMRRRRCLIPADGFYEWRVGAPKRPYFVRRQSGGPITFAGLWETWTGPNGEELDTADRHDTGKPHACRHPRSHASHRRAGRVQSLARLRECRRHDRRRADHAGARDAARML